MRLAYVRWFDASHSQDEMALEGMGLIELEDVGWPIAETDEFVTLTVERLAGAETMKTARLWLSIPRVNIIEMRVAQLDKAFPKRKRS